MRIYRIGLAILMFIIVILSACTNAKTDAIEVNESQVEQPDNSIKLRKETEHFQFYCVESDIECLEDLAETLEESYFKITADLKADLDFKVKVHVYKDLDTFHKSTGRTDAPDWVVGTTYGNGIHMVSPLNSGGVYSYESLIKVVAHEFTHVVMNNIASSGLTLPLWLHEGVAMYEANQTEQLYEVGKWVKSNRIPSLDSLESFGSYDTMSDNNVYPFSYTLVEYIVYEYGIEKLNDFIRSPYDYNGVFGVDKDEFEKAWKEYLKEKYESWG